MLTVERVERVETAPATATACTTCGTVTAPDGTCLEIGACASADATATRNATGGTAKFAVPAAWNARGRVD